MNNQKYDVVIVGGGLAGAALALKLTQAGVETLVIEKTTAFRDRVRGEWLAPWGVREVRDLGLADVLAEAGAHPVPMIAGRSLKPRRVTAPNGDIAVTFYHPHLQDSLLRRAEQAGAAIVRPASVRSVTARGQAVVEYDGPDGRSVATARLAIGADGRESLARTALQREEQVHVSSRTLAGVRLMNVSGDDSVGYMMFGEGSLASLFPQGDGYARAYIFEAGVRPSAFAGPDGLERFMGALRRNGVPASVLDGAAAAGPLAAFSADDTWLPRPAGGSVALVGDAAGVSDPTWGMGMALAFRDARVLSQLLLARRDWREATHAYARARDRYYGAMITAERWQTEIQLTPGALAEERRKFIFELWSRDPARALDLPGHGPSHDVSEAGRVRTFGDDIVNWLPRWPSVEDAAA